VEILVALSMSSSNASINSPYARSYDSNERRTSRRGFSAVLRLSNTATNVDPVSILMGKTSAFFGYINETEFSTMCATHGWDPQRGRAYIESVTSAPFDTFQTPVVHSETRLNLPHPMANQEKIVWIQGTIYDESGRGYNPGETISALQEAFRNDPTMASHIDNIVWKENALGTSAARMMDKIKRGEFVPPVFWTKNVENELTLQDSQWEQLDRLPGENPMVRYAYITPAGRMRKLSELIRDLANWVMSTITLPVNNVDPGRTVVGSDVAHIVRVKPPSPLPVQTMHQSSHGLMYVLDRPSVFPSSRLSALTNGRFQLTITPAMMATAYVMHDPYVHMRPLADFTADYCWEYKDNSWYMRAIPLRTSVASEMQNDPIDVIIMPAGTGKTTYAKKHPELFDVDDIINATSVKDNMKLLRRRAMETNKWDMVNDVNGEMVIDAYKSGKLKGKILLIHHEDALGKRVEITVLGAMKPTYSDMMKVADERSEHDKMWGSLTQLNWSQANVPIMARKDMDTFVKNIVNNYRNRVAPEPVVMNNLYEVIDPNFCMGWGSVAVAWHTNLGVGASLVDKRIREEVRIQRGLREVSGHAISSLMMYPSHFLWYLYELATNYMTRTSIYAFPFDEHRSGRYHDLEEYRAGLDVADRLKIPQYARNNTRVFRRVLDSLQDGMNSDEKSF